MTGTWASKNTLPHSFRCINTSMFSFSFYSINKFCNKITIACSIMSTPWASSTWISLNINPYSTVRRWCNSRNHLINLSSCAFTSTREHVNICFKTSCFSILKSLNCIMIDSSIRTKSSDNNKFKTLFF